ncbi:MAG: UDP-N-acetylglucosamine 2-epimerase (non-hydrolyzing) [Clostridiales bacterium]|nr:UDP-N-acetylglucosamine 2-epimerase (non-hydrolyzing) [Clostridiales bacterium]
MKKRVAVIFGTRPELIKVAPVIWSLRSHPHFEVLPLSTGQHRELLLPFLEVLEVEAAAHLDLLQEGQPLESLLARGLLGLRDLFREMAPHLVLVQGDTVTTLAGALAAFYARIPLGHIEAGLRSGSLEEPFPEEGQRRLVTPLAALQLAPTPGAAQALLREGIPEDAIYVTGNTVVDAFLWMVERVRKTKEVPPWRKNLPPGARIVAVEMHRRENWGEPIRRVARALARVVARHPDVAAVVSLHPNPQVTAAFREELEGQPRILLHPAFSYPEWVRLVDESYLLLSDSGGLQEEAPSLGKPLLIARRRTERPEAIAAGCARLVGTDTEEVEGHLETLLRDEGAYQAMARAPNPFGDGRAASRIVGALEHFFGLGPRPEPFGGGGAGG